MIVAITSCSLCFILIQNPAKMISLLSTEGSLVLSLTARQPGRFPISIMSQKSMEKMHGMEQLNSYFN
jgi:hypothetical protein